MHELEEALAELSLAETAEDFELGELLELLADLDVVDRSALVARLHHKSREANLPEQQRNDLQELIRRISTY